MPTSLPANATPLERALAQVVEELLEGLPIPLRELRDPARCPVGWLPWLAWERSVDFWSADWAPAIKRQAIRHAHALHREKGTVRADRRVLEDVGALYTRTENPAGAHHTVKIAIRNSGSLTLSVDQIAAAIRQVARASVHYTLVATAGLSGTIHVAGGLGARALPPGLLGLTIAGAGSGGQIRARAGQSSG